MEFHNNTTTHSNGTSYTSEHYKVILKWISFVIFLGIIIFNTLVIVLLLSRKKKTRMGFFVSNLAISDLCLGLFYVFPELVFNKFGVPWNKYVCYIVYAFLSQWAVYVSIYAIVVMSIDRLYVIVRPLSAASKGQKYRFGLASVAWITGAVLAVQYAVHIISWKTGCVHFIPYMECPELERQILRTACKRKATNVLSERPSKIINSEIFKIEEENLEKKDLKYVCQSMYRERRKLRPA